MTPDRIKGIAVLVGVLTLSACAFGGLLGEFLLVTWGRDVPDTLPRGAGAAQGALVAIVTLAMHNRQELRKREKAGE